MTTEETNKKEESKLLIDSSVLGVEGIRGSGKTLFATYLTLHAHKVLGAKVFPFWGFVLWRIYSSLRFN